jgi:hypothetical protein
MPSSGGDFDSSICHGAPALDAPTPGVPAAGVASLKEKIWNPPANLVKDLDAIWKHDMSNVLIHLRCAEIPASSRTIKLHVMTQARGEFCLPKIGIGSSYTNLLAQEIVLISSATNFF